MKHMQTPLTIYSMDHVPGRDPLLHILVGAYFLTNSFLLTVRKYISLLLEQVWRGYNQAPEKYSTVNIEIGISQNTKCAIWNGFPRSSHKLFL